MECFCVQCFSFGEKDCQINLKTFIKTFVKLDVLKYKTSVLCNWIMKQNNKFCKIMYYTKSGKKEGSSQLLNLIQDEKTGQTNSL